MSITRASWSMIWEVNLLMSSWIIFRTSSLLEIGFSYFLPQLSLICFLLQSSLFSHSVWCLHPISSWASINFFSQLGSISNAPIPCLSLSVSPWPYDQPTSILVTWPAQLHLQLPLTFIGMLGNCITSARIEASFSSYREPSMFLSCFDMYGFINFQYSCQATRGVLQQDCIWSLV